MSLKITKNQYPLLSQRLTHLTNTNDNGWALRCAKLMERLYLDYLENQGETGGSPPPLSSATRLIREVTGEPDGSGIRDHVTVAYSKSGNNTIATLGIPQGKPSMIAKVQNDGAVIGVTERMRGFLAHCGIFLKPSTTQIVIPGRHAWDYALRDTVKEAKKDLKGVVDDV